MPNRQFYTYKFASSFIKEFGFNRNNTELIDIHISVERAKQNKQIIALADNQFLRNIRKITNRELNLSYLELLYASREKIKKKPSSEKNSREIKEIQQKIDSMMFIGEYITIEFDHPTHYDLFVEYGFMINGNRYRRLSCSAGQARTSTVVFCSETIINDMFDLIDNGRDLEKKHSGSKLNAYIGLNSSATHIVSEPRFCVIKDYSSLTKPYLFNFVTETDWEEDDLIEVKELEQEINRFDGQGLISPQLAKKWAEELGLDYIPSQWCLRQNFMKGMNCVFDFHEFARIKNDGNYMIETSYKDSDGNYIMVDVRNYDLIISESQFKLWDSFKNSEEYSENCRKNGLFWGISLYSPKEDKNILKMNYQFLQTLDIPKDKIPELASMFVNWIDGVTGDNFYYTLLFLMGKDIGENGFTNFMEMSDNYWIKCLIANPKLYNDKYFKSKIYDLIKIRIKKACMGDIIVEGNFQVLVSDPYAQAQHMFGQKVTGLLGENQYYSNYWNKKDVKLVDSMRAPLTFRSEHVKLNLIMNDETEFWYKWCTSGILVNVFGIETVRWAGSDFDFDILATTSNKTVIEGVYDNELPVVYNPPKPEKVKITEEVLVNADKFAFGSAIGSITNKNTSAQSLLPMFSESSLEHKILLNRIKMCTKLQSAQIDKAKIGREVKGIPKHWIERQRINEDDTLEVVEWKKLNNSILLNRHPYFFRYLYSDTNSAYNKHLEHYNIHSQRQFRMDILTLEQKTNRNDAENKLVANFREFLPIIDSSCVMNDLCKYIESVNFDIKKRINNVYTENMSYLFKNHSVEYNQEMFEKVETAYKNNKAKIAELMKIKDSSRQNKFSMQQMDEFKATSNILKNLMSKECSNMSELVNYLIDIIYKDKNQSGKSLLWDSYGAELYKNVKENTGNTKVMFPFRDSDGDIEYLGSKFKIREADYDKLHI